MSDVAHVAQLPECDIHKSLFDTPGVPATYDGKTMSGPWANMCAECFAEYGVGLGTGRGQRLIVCEKPGADEQAHCKDPETSSSTATSSAARARDERTLHPQHTTPNRCSACQVPGHNACPLDPGCTCCTDTLTRMTAGDPFQI